MSDGMDHRDQQSETVGPPHGDADPPERTKQPIAWILLAVAGLVILAGLLVWAAVQAA